MYLIGDNVILRAIEEKDLEMLRSLINNPDIERQTMGFNYPVSEYHQKQWFYNLSNDLNNVRWIISWKDGSAIGMCSLHNIDWKNRVSKIGIKLIDEVKSKGIGIETYNLVIKYAFEELQLNRIESEVIDYNYSSIKLHSKIGFYEEGRKRKSVFQKGKYFDTIIFGIVYEEFRNNKYYQGE